MKAIKEYARIGIMIACCVGILVSLDHIFQKTWIVQITFCDTRQPRQIYVDSWEPPTSDDIEKGGGNRDAVTSYYGYLNVCEVKTIKQLK